MSENTEPLVVKREGWSSGPWDGEPDKVNWTTAAGLPGMIVRNPMGALCGYVAVTHGHPCFGLDFRSRYEKDAEGEDDYDREIPNPVHALSVHGGITYGDRCGGHICHVPAPGEPDDVWWLGFDTAHGGDLVPGMAALDRKHGLRPFSWRSHDTYRDIAYVRAEVERLAEQLVGMVKS